MSTRGVCPTKGASIDGGIDLRTTINKLQASGGSKAKQGGSEGMGGGLRSRVGASRSESNGAEFIELTLEGATPVARYPKEITATTTSEHEAIRQIYY
jgi:hypothetical protein